MRDSANDTRSTPVAFKVIGSGMRNQYSCLACPKRWEKRVGGMFKRGIWWCPDCTEKMARERAERKAA